MGVFNLKQKKSKTAAVSVQTSSALRNGNYLASYYPFTGRSRAFEAIRESVPIIDAALNKLVRLTDGFTFVTGDENTDAVLNAFMNGINVGGNQQGISAFASNYLNQLLTFGTAVGEIVLSSSGIYALYNSDLSQLELKRSFKPEAKRALRNESSERS